jgi:hypothetical protein
LKEDAAMTLDFFARTMLRANAAAFVIHAAAYTILHDVPNIILSLVYGVINVGLLSFMQELYG